MRRRFTCLLIPILLLPMLIGCGNAPPKLVPITGTVRLDGRPLQHGMILLEAEGTPSAMGMIVNGEILEVTTHEPNDGAMTGVKKVAVRPYDASKMTSKNASPAPKPATLRSAAIPSRYLDPNTSGLTCEVVDGPNKLFFTLMTEDLVETPIP
jgi:hypothetical protein